MLHWLVGLSRGLGFICNPFHNQGQQLSRVNMFEDDLDHVSMLTMMLHLFVC